MSDYTAFRTRREAALLAPFGPAALVATQWVSEIAEPLEQVSGTWCAVNGTVVAQGIDPAEITSIDDGVLWRDSDLVFAPDTAVIWRAKQLLAIERYGTYGLRIFDPEAPGRKSLRGVDVYPYDPKWVVEAEFALVEATAVEIDLVNGMRVPGNVTATCTFQLDAQTVTMQLDSPPGEPTVVSFLDKAASEAGAPLRFLPIRWPEGNVGKTTLDFNYVTLPPCSFSPHFMCPLPLAANRLPFAVTAGERSLLRM
ncbi:MAG: DUF1684 domain-containing protein [Propionibacteriaceae bacterium]|jgi:uncharacterized protein (DUF1684 family)|nr:DUF1684 domain-containing protein [Propionibacteriaceae bacterium]